MISSEVQRTLVKSPPELWAELSDPTALSRHLGDLGEIRITRVEPERLLEWEAEGTTGTVKLKASGWGTKVTLSVSREVALAAGDGVLATGDIDTGADLISATAEPDRSAVASEPTSEPAPEPPLEPAPEIGPAQAIPEPLVERAIAEREPTSTSEASVEAEMVEPTEQRRGFFARLFGRRRATSEQRPSSEEPADNAPPACARTPEPGHAAEDEAEVEAERPLSAIEALEARYSMAAARQIAHREPEAEAEPKHAQATAAAVEAIAPAAEKAPEETPSELVKDIAAELEAAENVAMEEVTAVLTAALDRLGAAHHRPFSRA